MFSLYVAGRRADAMISDVKSMPGSVRSLIADTITKHTFGATNHCMWKLKLMTETRLRI